MSVGRVLSFVVLCEKFQYTNATGLVYFHIELLHRSQQAIWPLGDSQAS